ncbi:hypothetical protein DPMN_136092 [Dreissena polymorpha]|uniref:Uncharacterized protein n=1 Tax=Dreissena polymorpha TaxID=45954 RepID=A0A9D4FZ13_DREPO|nr:hypothetical protein DPMN_136092 [Dreissena polymorpha]
MGCSSSRSPHIKTHRLYDDIQASQICVPKQERGIPDGEEKYLDTSKNQGNDHQREAVDFSQRYQRCQVTETTYLSTSTSSLNESLT